VTVPRGGILSIRVTLAGMAPVLPIGIEPVYPELSL